MIEVSQDTPSTEGIGENLKHKIEALQDVQAKVPIQAQAAIQRAIDRSLQHSQKKIEFDVTGSKDSIPVLLLVGGKWTTFRALAEQASDRILRRLGCTRSHSTECMKIGGGKGYPKTEEDRAAWISRVSKKTGVGEGRIETLLYRYGTRAEKIAEFISTEVDQELINYPSFSRCEIAYIVQHEDVVHLDDFLLRRSMIGMLGLSSKDGLDELGQVVGGVPDWTDNRIQNEIQRTVHILRVNHKMDFNRYFPD